jgi:hypothetical protein
VCLKVIFHNCTIISPPSLQHVQIHSVYWQVYVGQVDDNSHQPEWETEDSARFSDSHKKKFIFGIDSQRWVFLTPEPVPFSP